MRFPPAPFAFFKNTGKPITTVLFTLLLAVLTLQVWGGTATVTVDFNTINHTISPLTFSVDESGYGGRQIAVDSTFQARMATLKTAMMRLDLGYTTPGDPTSTIVCQAGGATHSITGDQWVAAVRAAGALPAIHVQMNTANSQAIWVIDASNMVKHFNFDETSNYVGRWIIGNEPDGNGISVATYSAGFAAMYNAMKAVDPTIKIGGPTCAYYDTSFLSTFISNMANQGIIPDFIDWHSYGTGNSTHLDDAPLLAITKQKYEDEPEAIRTMLVNQWGATIGNQIPIELGEWNAYGTSYPNQLQNYASVWTALALSHMVKANIIERFYTDKNGLTMGLVVDQANPTYSNVTYTASTDDPLPAYHGIGMFTGEGLFPSFGSNIVPVTVSSSTGLIDAAASGDQMNIVAINSSPTDTNAAIFNLTGVFSGSVTIWQKNGDGPNGSVNVPLNLGTNQFSGGSFSYTLNPYTVTTFVITPGQVTNMPPVITMQPQSQTINQGSNVTFNVTAGGTPTLIYQWLLNNTNISGATGNSYTKTNVQPSDAGNYSVIVTNNFGSLTSSNAVLTVATNSALQTLWLDFNTSGQYTGNFNNPNTTSPCTETNAGGVTNSGALLVTGGDGNATYNAASWNFSTNTAAISVSMMLKIQQATGTGNKIQLGIVSDNTAGFAIASGNFGSFRLLPQSTTAPTYQLACQTAVNGTTGGGNVGTVITLTVGHWYQFNTFFTNTGPGTSCNIACGLIDYGTNGATQGTNMFTFNTLQTITGTQAAISSDNSVWPAFRVANNTGVLLVDNFAVNITGSATLPPPLFGAPALSNGQLTLTWTGGSSQNTVLSATNLAGPWTPLTTTTSPYIIPVDPNAPQQFFRLEQ